MSRKWLLSLVCFLQAVVCSFQLTSATGELRVNEAKTRVRFHDGKIEVLLAIENSATGILPRRIHIELLDPQNRIRSSVGQTELIGCGYQTLHLLLPLDVAKLGEKDRSQLIWYRLHYRIAPDKASSGPSAEGIVSLSEITPDLFEVRVAAAELAHEGMRYRARVQTGHPITQKPAGGVRVDAVVTLETDDDGNGVKLRATGVTDSTGYAILNFDLPPRFPQFPHELRPAGGSIKVTASREGLIAEAENQVLVDQFPRILISTDKPLYQPGQLLHVRALVLSPTRHALANQDVIFRVSDPEETNVFRETVKSSRFGIANVDWPIPENMRLGDYWIKVALGDGEDSSQTNVRVRISRYDLPNFSVKVRPDHPYYLPGQNAEVKVSADYLFGQPVTRGHVRVVRETEREWNYKEQKWDIEEGDKYEGDTDANGGFLTHVRLADYHGELSDEDYRRFKDITYVAYFTDPTTKRTEQRRFDLRITKELIHVYVIMSDDAYRQNSRLPLRFYVSTFYADGTPAQCRVNVSLKKDGTKEVPKSAPADVLLTTLRTNRYGLAKVRLRLPNTPPVGDVELKIAARDFHGKTGSHTEEFRIDDDSDQVRLETDKTLYRFGEPITAFITSSATNTSAVIDIGQDYVVLSSQKVRLHRGRAAITIPYKPQFKDKLTIAAYADFANAQAMISTRTILFPRDRDLKVDAHPTAKDYRPGDEAQVSLRVRGPEGQAAASALGLVIVDKAVDERFRTDREFGNRSFGFYGSMHDVFGSDEQIAGVTFRDLQRIDMSRPVSPELELVAEVLLNQNRNYYPVFFGGDSYERDQVKVFGDSIRLQLAQLKDTLATRYAKTGEYPNGQASLRRLLSESGIDFDSLQDPWGSPYRPVFSIDKQSDVLSFTSAGADKRFDTNDDFSIESNRWAYFRPTGEAIDRAVHQYHERTGDFIRDFATLSSEVSKTGFNFDSPRDRWDQPYRFDFDVVETHYVIKVSSSGPDKQFRSELGYLSDDFTIWTSSIDYFAEARAQIDAALNGELKKTNHLPQTEPELRQTLHNSNIDLGALKDPWGHPFYTVFSEHSFYGDRVTIETRAKYGDTPKERTEIKPVTQRVVIIKLRSAGPDCKPGTADDFDAATFTGIVAEQTSIDAKPKTVATTFGLSGDTGAIVGVIKDPNGAAIADASVSAKTSATTQVFETLSDADGKYLLRNLPAGVYEVRVVVTGFKIVIVTSVPVSESSITELNITPALGAPTETVTVTSEAPRLQTTSVSSAQVNELPINGRQYSLLRRTDPRINVVTKSGSSDDQVSTPRLREYFPETLVWQPSLETDKKGRAQLKFKLADNITTWKMSVIGSTEDGEIGTAETEIKAFQPFFVEHDPPRVLTEGDQISLPVVLRNYLERAQTVELEMKPESWFTLTGPSRQRASIAAGESVRETFDLKAIASVKDGKQRVTATGTEASDAIEKPVTVHPDGEQETQTASDVFGDATTLNVIVPDSVISGSMQAELKFYPNLMAHVVESIEGILERPYGCGEQTISSTYPSLLVLRHYQQGEQGFQSRQADRTTTPSDRKTSAGDPGMSALPGKDSRIVTKARAYAQLGYQRLLNYRAENGGFTYWGRGEADLALTAYALRFLHDAREFVSVDEDVGKAARQWLIKQQRADGSWPAYDYYPKQIENQRRTALLTAFVARVLATTDPSAKIDGTSSATKQQPLTTVSTELRRALSYLRTKAEEIDEGYLVASYALAAIDAGDASGATRAIAKLRTLAHPEGDTTYWALETDTPFYGWGLAGRVETTALAVQALARTSAAGKTSDPLVRSGLLFLFRQKDRYGVWYSTQATINVLDTLMTLLARDASSNQVGVGRMENPVEVVVNGQFATSIKLPTDNQPAALMRADISRFLRNGANRIELRRAAGSSLATVQLVTNYYVPWSASAAAENSGTRTEGASALRLAAIFDKNDAKTGDEIACHVKAERVGFRGYGMMLAEIGLPPGADVDRASLETAMKSSDWSISQYDVLPDRVVVYLWPRAGGVDFNFKFRPRFALTAKTAPSIIYDYYNPEARSVVAPKTFVVK